MIICQAHGVIFVEWTWAYASTSGNGSFGGISNLQQDVIPCSSWPGWPFEVLICSGLSVLGDHDSSIGQRRQWSQGASVVSKVTYTSQKEIGSGPSETLVSHLILLCSHYLGCCAAASRQSVENTPRKRFFKLTPPDNSLADPSCWANLHPSCSLIFEFCSNSPDCCLGPFCPSHLALKAPDLSGPNSEAPIVA